MTASLLTKDALSKLPADLREHIIVENENVYGLTLHMSIGDFERLVAPHDLLDQMRYAVAVAESEAKAADERAEDAEDEAEDAFRERDAIAKAVQTVLGIMDDEVAVRVDSPLAAAIEALEELL
jgi:hypothetical protein